MVTEYDRRSLPLYGGCSFLQIRRRTGLSPDLYGVDHRPSDFDLPINPLKNRNWRITMKEINLREFYPEIYKTDLFISLPDEVVDVLVEYQRKEVAYRRRTYRHKAFLSLDYGDDIEREAVLFTPTLQEIVERHLEEERLYQAISSLPEKQRQRVYAHYILGITLMDIAKMEGVSLHAVHESIRRGLRRLEKILEENF
jgi:DNA-directed RNA polymerase specialized sigma subunit, sigma24 homolog